MTPMQQNLQVIHSVFFFVGCQCLHRTVLTAGHVVVRPGWVYGEGGGNYAGPWCDKPSVVRSTR
jgi:hypothetical protein